MTGGAVGRCVECGCVHAPCASCAASGCLTCRRRIVADAERDRRWGTGGVILGNDSRRRG